MPAIKEIVTNKIGSPIKRIEKGNRIFIIRKARTEITEDNFRVLQFLDLLKDLEKYSELYGQELNDCLKRYMKMFNISKSELDKYLPLYHDKIYRTIYETGIMFLCIDFSLAVYLKHVRAVLQKSETQGLAILLVNGMLL